MMHHPLHSDFPRLPVEVNSVVRVRAESMCLMPEVADCGI